MRAIIIGGGIAGLSAAVGLRRAGHDVLVSSWGNCPSPTCHSSQIQANTRQVVERSSFLNEVGAAIHVPPNASKILLRWGFDTERAMADVALIVSVGKYNISVFHFKNRSIALFLLSHWCGVVGRLRADPFES